MPENFFEPGKKSHCLFSPDLWCEVFNPTAPFSPFEFICDVTPQLVGVVLPAPEGEAGEVWDRIYDTIKSVWQARQVGFHCARIDAAAWSEERPCAACGLVRQAQVVIIDFQGGDLRAASFREMATGSRASLQIVKAFGGEAANKRVVLISCGRINLPPFYQKVFDWIDYTGADGQPDLEKLAGEMDRIAREDLFQPGEALRLDAEDFAEPAAAGVAAAALPDIDVPSGGQTASGEENEESWADEIHILGEVPVGGSTQPVATPEEQIAEVLGKVGGLMNQASYAGAFEALLAVEGLYAADVQGRLPGMERECVCRMGAKDLAGSYFRGMTERDRSRVELSAWTEGVVSSARLRLRTPDQAMPAVREVTLFACDQPVPEALDLLPRQTPAAPGADNFAVLVVGEGGEEVCRHLAQLRAERILDIHLADLRTWLLERRSPLESLRERYLSDYRRKDDRFLCGLHQPVAAEGEFFGRCDLLKQLGECLRSGDGFALHGLPRSGKTSVLRRLARHPDWRDDLVVVIDLKSHAADRPAELYARTVRAIKKAAATAVGAGAEGGRRLDLSRCGELFTLSPTAALETFRGRFGTDLRSLVKELRHSAACGARRLVLLFDDIDPALAGDHRGFFAQLRDFMQDGSIVIGMTGRGFKLRQELADRTCPLRGIREHFLPGLSAEECSQLILRVGHQMYRHFDEAAVQQIVRESGGQPFLVRGLCSFTLEAAPAGGATLGEENVQLGVDRALDARNLRRRLEWLYADVERHLGTGADVLKAMAVGLPARPDRGIRRSRLEAQTEMDPTALGQLLRVLEAYGLVDVGPAECRHRVGLLASWLRTQPRNMPLSPASSGGL